MKQNQHEHSDTVPEEKGPRPAWATKLGIPPECNEDFLSAKLNIVIIKMMLFGADNANGLNKKFKQGMLRKLMQCLFNGKFIEYWHDPILIDWNWRIISGQKRLYAYFYAYISGKLHRNYLDGIGLNIRYGVNPAHRKHADDVDQREFKDMSRLVPNPRINELIHQTCKLVAKIHNGFNTSHLSVLDNERCFNTNRTGFIWACSLPVKGSLLSAPIRLAIAEGYKLHPETTQAFANELFDLPSKSQRRVETAKVFRRWYLEKKHHDQQTPYAHVVGALQALFDDIPFISAEPFAGWRRDQLDVLDYPVLEKPVFSDGKQDEKFVKALVSFGFPNGHAVAASARLLAQQVKVTDEYILEQIRANKDKWALAEREYAKLRPIIGPFSAAAIIAFVYTNLDSACHASYSTNDAVIRRLNEASRNIKARFGNLRSRCSREACLAALYAATGLTPPDAAS